MQKCWKQQEAGENKGEIKLIDNPNFISIWRVFSKHWFFLRFISSFCKEFHHLVRGGSNFRRFRSAITLSGLGHAPKPQHGSRLSYGRAWEHQARGLEVLTPTRALLRECVADLQNPVGQKRHLDVAGQKLPRDNLCLSAVSQFSSPGG